MACTYRTFRQLRHRLRRHSVRRYALFGVLLAYVMVVIGIPLPFASSTSSSKKSGELFPCMNSPCGCRTADHCWRSCCCHSFAARLEWARQHHVRPPEFALQQARSQQLDLRWLEVDEGDDSTVTSLAAMGAPKNCCCDKTDCASPTSKLAIRHPVSKGGRYIVGFRALACRGIMLFKSFVVPTIISLDNIWCPQPTILAWLGPLSPQLPLLRFDLPVPPPPERA